MLQEQTRLESCELYPVSCMPRHGLFAFLVANDQRMLSCSNSIKSSMAHECNGKPMGRGCASAFRLTRELLALDRNDELSVIGALYQRPFNNWLS